MQNRTTAVAFVIERNDVTVGTQFSVLTHEHGRITINTHAVISYLAEHYPRYTVEQYEKYNATKDETYIRYRINGIENLTLYEKLDFAVELRVKFHVTNGYCYSLDPVSPNSTTGHNALEQLGDTNLDCEVDILDVIAANKHILGIGTLDKTGLKNADMNGNGTIDPDDSLAILKTVIA